MMKHAKSITEHTKKHLHSTIIILIKLEHHKGS